MTLCWNGHTGFDDGVMRARIRRSHGNWLAIVYWKNGNVRAGEYLSYGEPGAIQRAKNWCERQLERQADQEREP